MASAVSAWIAYIRKPGLVVSPLLLAQGHCFRLNDVPQRSSVQVGALLCWRCSLPQAEQNQGRAALRESDGQQGFSHRGCSNSHHGQSTSLVNLELKPRGGACQSTLVAFYTGFSFPWFGFPFTCWASNRFKTRFFVCTCLF